MGFKKLIQQIKSGEAVVSGVPNRPTREIHNNTLYLLELIDAAMMGETIFAREQTVEADALVGMPVYFNPDTKTFERGLAQVELNIVTGQFDTAVSAQIWGVVYSKDNPTLADILLFGYAPLDFSPALAAGDSTDAGLYYLSSVTPGRLQQTRPAIGIPVIRADGQGNVFVNPEWRDALTDHVHHQFDLLADVAGTHTPPSPGGIHTITAADNLQEGWLPASDPIFDGTAPAEAVFGYNISANEQLAALWPPVPPESADLMMARESVDEQNFEMLQQVPPEMVVIDRNGIWWMSDCFGQVPWPTDLDTTATVSASSDSCPLDVAMQLKLYFVRSTFFTEVTAVTSLRSVDERLIIECENKPGVPATTGALQVRLDLAFAIGDTDLRGWLAFKNLQGDGNTFDLGPVAEGLYALSSNVTLTSPFQTLLIEGDEDSPLVHHGPVGIAVDTVGETELPVQLVRLDNTTEEFFKDVMYVGLPSGELTRYRAKIQVPASLGITSPKLKLRMRILGRVAGTLPVLTVTGRVLPAPADFTADEVALPAADTAVTIDTARTITTANNYVEVESDEITIAAGDDFYFYVQRSSGDGYSGEIGILKQVGIVVVGS